MRCIVKLYINGSVLWSVWQRILITSALNFHITWKHRLLKKVYLLTDTTTQSTMAQLRLSDKRFVHSWFFHNKIRIEEFLLWHNVTLINDNHKRCIIDSNKKKHFGFESFDLIIKDNGMPWSDQVIRNWVGSCSLRLGWYQILSRNHWLGIYLFVFFISAVYFKLSISNGWPCRSLQIMNGS